ncbi:MAG: glucosaminidase domain-containing protein [Lachnospiraceae bacterium]|nr:glucosaminidase domain-containing protein [Lachnospiraceae bacterium]
MLSLKNIWDKVKRIDIRKIPGHIYLYVAAVVILSTSIAISVAVKKSREAKEDTSVEVVEFVTQKTDETAEEYEEGYVEGSDEEAEIIQMVSSSVSDGPAKVVIMDNKPVEITEFVSQYAEVPDSMKVEFVTDTFVDYNYERAVSTNTGILTSREILSNHYKATGETMIMGTTDVTLGQMVAYYNSKSKSYPEFYKTTDAPNIETFCQLYINECTAEGVRYDIAFCQAMKETGFLHYGGSVSISQFNFAGMGASGGGKHGCVYNSVQEGIRAHVQHLKAFASTADMVNEPVDQRWSKVRRGSAVYVEYLGINENPKHTGWATAERYGYSLMNDYVAVLASY